MSTDAVVSSSPSDTQRGRLHVLAMSPTQQPPPKPFFGPPTPAEHERQLAEIGRTHYAVIDLTGSPTGSESTIVQTPKTPMSPDDLRGLPGTPLAVNTIEPDFRKRILRELNARCRSSFYGLYHRLQQPSTKGHCVLYRQAWTQEEADAFARDYTLPAPKTTDPGQPHWLFDIRPVNGELPRLPELCGDLLPDLERWPEGYCVFLYESWKYFGIKSSLLRVEVGAEGARFVWKKDGRRSLFETFEGMDVEVLRERLEALNEDQWTTEDEREE